MTFEKVPAEISTSLLWKFVEVDYRVGPRNGQIPEALKEIRQSSRWYIGLPVFCGTPS